MGKQAKLLSTLTDEQKEAVLAVVNGIVDRPDVRIDVESFDEASLVRHLRDVLWPTPLRENS